MKLILAFLGPFHVTLNGQPARFATARGRALLAYLAAEADRPHRREALADLLWPDHSETLARRSLSQELVRLRRAILDGDGPASHLHITATTLQFNAAGTDVDVTHFQSLLAACADHRHDAIERCPACLSRLRAAIALYQGDFLAGFSLKDNQPFNEWSLFRREHLRRRALDALDILVRHALNAADYVQVQRYAQRQVELEPWYEEGHRHLMRALAAMGQRSAALAQYDVCRRILVSELGVEPSAETRALHDSIRDADGEPRPQQHSAQGLPTPLTPFIGRSAELAEVHARLREPGVRLLTLVGLGGMGKTRLAIEAARLHADACPDGVTFVPLAPQSQPSTLAPAIANALGVTLRGTDVWAELLQSLNHRQALLVLDGLENLLALPTQSGGERVEQNAVRAVVELLEAAPNVQVLATSRVRLGLPGEHVYVVGGLDYPVQARVEEAAGAPAVRLLVESARKRNPQFTLTAANVASVLRICDLVRGMPLGIELAAAWLELLTPTQVAAEIEKSLDFLADEQSDAPSRQRSLRGVFEWSWRLLTESERQALRRLAVFRGSFTREAAQAVAVVSLRDLTGLVTKSLLRWNWARGDGGGYEMHDVVRQFAAEQLSLVPDEREAVEARHAAAYLDLLDGFDRRVDSFESAAAIRELQTEAVHVAQAWAWAVAHRDLDRLNRTLYSLWQFYFITGRWAEAERAFGQAVERLRGGELGESSTQAPTDALLSKLLAGHAYTLLLKKDYERALAVATEAIALTEASHAIEGLSLGEMLHGIILTRTGSPQAARLRFERALALSQQHHGDYPGEILWDVEWACEQGLAVVCMSSGDLAGADEHVHRALQLCQTRGKRHGEASCLLYLGDRAYRARDYATAGTYYGQMLQLEMQIGDRPGVGMAQLNLGETLRMRGEYGRARELLERGLATVREVGAVDELKAVACLSRLDLYLGDIVGARQHLALLSDAPGPAPQPEVKTFVLVTQALLALQMGDPQRALACAEEARRLQQGPTNPYETAATLIVLGHAAAAIKQWADAREAYQQAVGLCEMLVAPTLAAEAHAGLANVAGAEGKVEDALAHVEAILAILAEHPRVGLDEPFTTYLACYRVLAAACDPRAADILAQGYALLLDYAEQLADEALRQSFLENVLEHRELRRLSMQHTGYRQHDDEHPSLHSSA
ncbi:MAG: BTAD domain-containing putative transcriptional regulator [Anaerolineae bacterium]